MNGTYQSDLERWVKTEQRVAMRLDSARRRLQRCEEIEQEQLHPQADELKIAELKRKKLQIKDELAKLSISETRH